MSPNLYPLRLSPSPRTRLFSPRRKIPCGWILLEISVFFFFSCWPHFLTRGAYPILINKNKHEHALFFLTQRFWGSRAEQLKWKKNELWSEKGGHCELVQLPCWNYIYVHVSVWVCACVCLLQLKSVCFFQGLMKSGLVPVPPLEWASLSFSPPSPSLSVCLSLTLVITKHRASEEQVALRATV